MCSKMEISFQPRIKCLAVANSADFSGAFDDITVVASVHACTVKRSNNFARKFCGCVQSKQKEMFWPSIEEVMCSTLMVKLATELNLSFTAGDYQFSKAVRLMYKYFYDVM